MPDDVDQMPKVRASASQNVLIDDEKRLDGSNFSRGVLQYKIQIFEFGMGSSRLSDRNSGDLCAVMRMRVANMGTLATHGTK